MKKEIIILLPKKIYINKCKKNQDIVTLCEEYNIYYKNLIYPFCDSWDIVVNCEIGQNLGHCFRVSNYSGEKSEFPFEVRIYNEYGELLASEKSTLVFIDKEPPYKELVWLPFGDSMTYSQDYINHIVLTLPNTKTVGTRSIDKTVYHEGRGGWSYNSYLTNYYYIWGGISPFLFPTGINACDYYGNKEFADKTADKDAPTYEFLGYDYAEIKEGQYFSKKTSLYKRENGADVLVDENPTYEFSVKKYFERFGVRKPDVISVLLGANDLQISTYEEAEKVLCEYIKNARFVISKIKEYDSSIKIVVCLPIAGAEQYSWGIKLGCRATSKQYRYKIMNASKRLLDEFDSKENDNIYIAPMALCIDPENGFDKSVYDANMYTGKKETHQNNWVHPNESGYNQMGDALSAVLNKIKHEG